MDAWSRRAFVPVRAIFSAAYVITTRRVILVLLLKRKKPLRAALTVGDGCSVRFLGDTRSWRRDTIVLSSVSRFFKDRG